MIAPLINARWLDTQTDPVQQALWHILISLVLGMYLASQLPRVVVSGTRTDVTAP